MCEVYFLKLTIFDPSTQKKWDAYVPFSNFINSIKFVNSSDFGANLKSNFKHFLSFLFNPLSVNQITNNYRTNSQILTFMNCLSVNFFQISSKVINKRCIKNSKIKIKINNANATPSAAAMINNIIVRSISAGGSWLE